MDPPPSSIAIPFVYAIIIESDGAKTIHTAEQLAAGQDLGAIGWVLTRPMGGRPFLTRPWMPDADISVSNVQRPWLLEVEGDTPGDSSILFVLRGTEPDGTVWEQEFFGPCREILQSTTFVVYQYCIQMRPTSDGYRTPVFTGFSIEGDGRRFHIPASRLVQ